MNIKKLLPQRSRSIAAALLMMLFCVMGCADDSTDDLIMPAVPADTVITYTGHIAAVINTNCTGCHATVPENGAPMPLTTYEHVRQAILERGLIDRISRPQGAEGMMPNGGTRLPQATIDMIIQWQSQGFQP